MRVPLVEEASKAEGVALCAMSDSEGKLTTIEIAALTKDVESAEELAARFPKYFKFRGLEMYRNDGIWGWVEARWHFHPNKATGERNEAAINRALKFFDFADRKGIEVFCDEEHYASNSIVGRDRIIAAIKAL
jgi:hypothetical protein